MISYNDEISVSVPFDADFEVAIPAATLRAVLSKYSTDTVNMVVEDGELRISAGRRKNGIKIQNEIKLPVDSIQPPENMTGIHPDCMRAVNLVVNSCGKNASEYSLNCVHITDSRVEACDCFQATQYTLQTGFEQEFLLPSSAARMLVDVPVANAGIKDSWLFIESEEGTTYACRTYEMSYPDLNQIIKKEGKEITFPSSIVDALNGAAVFTNSTDGSVLVKVADKKITIKTENDEGWFEETAEDMDTDEAIEFAINPSFFAALLKHDSKCLVADTMLVVSNDYYTHVACLKV